MITGQYHFAKPCKVFIDGTPLRLGPSLQYIRASSYGFRWGICEEGATQLAFALLLHCCGAEDAINYFQMFQSDVTFYLPLSRTEQWVLFEDDIRYWVARKKALQSKSKWRIRYWNTIGRFCLFSEDFYNTYIKVNIPYEDWWSLRARPSIYITHSV